MARERHDAAERGRKHNVGETDYDACRGIFVPFHYGAIIALPLLVDPDMAAALEESGMTAYGAQLASSWNEFKLSMGPDAGVSIDRRSIKRMGPTDERPPDGERPGIQRGPGGTLWIVTSRTNRTAIEVDPPAVFIQNSDRVEVWCLVISFEDPATARQHLMKGNHGPATQGSETRV